jgi:hypothetical protein
MFQTRLHTSTYSTEPPITQTSRNTILQSKIILLAQETTPPPPHEGPRPPMGSDSTSLKTRSVPVSATWEKRITTEELLLLSLSRCGTACHWLRRLRVLLNRLARSQVSHILIQSDQSMAAHTLHRLHLGPHRSVTEWSSARLIHSLKPDSLRIYSILAFLHSSRSMGRVLE